MGCDHENTPAPFTRPPYGFGRGSVHPPAHCKSPQLPLGLSFPSCVHFREVVVTWALQVISSARHLPRPLTPFLVVIPATIFDVSQIGPKPPYETHDVWEGVFKVSVAQEA